MPEPFSEEGDGFSSSDSGVSKGKLEDTDRHTDSYSFTESSSESSPHSSGSSQTESRAGRGWFTGAADVIYSAINGVMKIWGGHEEDGETSFGGGSNAMDGNGAPNVVVNGGGDKLGTPIGKDAPPDATAKPPASEALLRAIRSYTDVVNRVEQTSAELIEEEMKLRECQASILGVDQITPEHWRAAHSCPKVWIMIKIFSEAGMDKLMHLSSEIQESVDDKLRQDLNRSGDVTQLDQGTTCAVRSGRDENYDFLDTVLKMPSIRITADQKQKLEGLGAEWEQLLYNYPHITQDLSYSCRDRLEKAWMHPICVILGVLFMYAEVTLMGVVFVSYRVWGLGMWSNISLFINAGGGFISFIIIGRLVTTMKEASAYSEPGFPWYWLKAVPVIPMFETSVGWYFLRNHYWPEEQSIHTQMNHYYIIQYDLRQLFHLARQLQSIFVSFPFVLFQSFLLGHEFHEESKYNNPNKDILKLAVYISLINVIRAGVMIVWRIATAINVTGMGMKRTFSYPPKTPPHPVLRVILVFLVYFLVYNSFISAISFGWSSCHSKYNWWLLVQACVTFCIVILVFFFSQMKEQDLQTSLKWLSIPFVFRVGWIVVGYVWFYGEEVSDCITGYEWATAVIIIDNIILASALVFFVFWIAKRFIEGRPPGLCCEASSAEGEGGPPPSADPIHEPTEEDATSTYEETTETMVSVEGSTDKV